MRKPDEELTIEQLEAEDAVLRPQSYTKKYWSLPTQAERDAFLEVKENYEMVGKEWLWENRFTDDFFVQTGKLHWQLTEKEMKNYYWNNHSNY
jgi:hypothetical protein